MNRNRRVAALGLAAVLTVSGTRLPSTTVRAEGEPGAVPTAPIMITEVVPNTDNLTDKENKSLDAWEYYEIANVSDKDVNLNNYNIVYDNGSAKTVWTATGVDVLPAGKTMLVWVRNGCNDEKSIADFRDYYGTKTGSAIPEDGLIAEVHCDGMANSGSRSMYIVTKTGKTLSTITYRSADSAEGKLGVDEAIVFQHSGNAGIPMYDQTPSPLALSDGNVSGTYTSPATVEAPTVEVAGPSSIGEGDSLKVTVSKTNLDIANLVIGTIQVEGGSYALTYDGEGNLAGEIPWSDVKDAVDQKFSYTVSVSDGVNTAASESHEVRVLSDTVDSTKAPELTITEILPDSSNINGADAYEFVEVYNNSNRAVNLKDYKLYYHYPTDNSDVIWWETSEDRWLEAGETLVFWVKNGSNDSLTRDDFNKKFGTSLSEDQLIEISCGGMANGSPRGLKLATNVKDDIDFVTYNMNGVDDTTADKSITYQNQYQSGSFQTVMTGNASTPTPGTVTENEKPDYQAQITAPANAPVLNDLTPAEFSNETENFSFDLQADSEETTIKTVNLYVKYNNKETFECYNLTRSDGDHFVKTLGNVDILNKSSFTYYFKVSDGFQTVQSEEKTISNTSGVQNPLFNLQDQETIAGSRQVIANGEALRIDGQDVSTDAKKSLNGPGKIVFDASQTDVFFKNAVAVGDKVVGIFNEGTYDQWATYVYDIDEELFDPDTKTITVAFHAGNKANVLEHNIENNDDFVLKNIRMVMPDGETLYPASYQAKMGLGEVEHSSLDDQKVVDVTSKINSQEKEIQLGDGTSKYEIFYATFDIPESEFGAVRYLWNTKDTTDGSHEISNGTDTIQVKVDNTAPEISTSIEDGKEYHGGTITVETQDASGDARVTALLDGKAISLPYEFRALTMTPGEHKLNITASDVLGNTASKEVTFTTPKESAEIDENVKPENGAQIDGYPILSVTPTDEAGDNMTVTFKKGEHYVLADDTKITRTTGVSDTSGKEGQVFDADSGNGFPYETFDIAVGETADVNTAIQAKWTGTSNNEKTFMYAYNTVTGGWDQLEAARTTDGENMTLTGEVTLENHLTADGKVRIMVQNGEGYTPVQYAPGTEQVNPDDTPRSNYQFTFAVESDTQYYNEDYEGNPNRDVDGKYQYQLDIHNWLLANRERMNIQYLFHDGDIIDDEPLTPEWDNADAAYRLLDDAGLPYGVLAGNHDVGHLSGDYTNYSKYFGEWRYVNDPWYGESYKDNRCHYDLITVDGIDFIMLYTGWGITDEEISWMNQVLAQYPERKAILNFHEYLLASGGMGEEPQRVYDEVVAKNENVCMVLSGHYHNAYTRVDEFTNADGSTRKVYNMLFDYQDLPEGGMGYMRLMHFDTVNDRIIVRTYSPSLDDYDANTSAVQNEGNTKYVAPNANLNGEENFVIPFAELGITPKPKTLTTTGLDVNVYGTEMIGQVEDVASGTEAQYVWNGAPDGVHGWYAEVTDENGGLSRTSVQYLTVLTDTTAPVLTVPEGTELYVGDAFNPYDGVTASDDRDGDLTGSVTVAAGEVDTGKEGIYELTYAVVDRAGNRTEVKRTVTVKAKEGSLTGSDNSDSSGGTSGVQNQNKADGKTPAGKSLFHVKTGDEAKLGVLIMTELAAIVAMVVLLFRRRRKRH